MYAIIEIGGKQYKMREGDKLRVERLNTQVGDTVAFDKVPFLGGDDVKADRPYVEGAKIGAKVLKQNEAKKVIVYKSEAKKNYRDRREHRQPYTFIEIGAIA